MRCPSCGREEDVVRGGPLVFRPLRELIAPQKYRCRVCECRWLDWPWVYRARSARVLRRIRRSLGGGGEWRVPPEEQGGAMNRMEAGTDRYE